jgi:hypothetical protein
MDSFKDFHNRGNNEIRPGIGFFPGGFKPPHVGHFAAAQSILGIDMSNPETGGPILLDGSVTSDFLHVLIGHGPRGSTTQNQNWKRLKSSKVKDNSALEIAHGSMITKDMSENIWNLYISSATPSIKGKAEVTVSPHASPVIGMEMKILDLESSIFKTHTINLYAGAEDQSRYQYFTGDKFKMKISETKNIEPNLISIKANHLDRLGSATDARSQVLRVAAEQADIETIKRFIPAGVDPLKFLKLLKTFRER